MAAIAIGLDCISIGVVVELIAISSDCVLIGIVIKLIVISSDCVSMMSTMVSTVGLMVGLTVGLTVDSTWLCWAIDLSNAFDSSAKRLLWLSTKRV